VDDLPRLQFDDEEGKERTKEEIGDLQEITSPNTFRMIAQKGRPGLSSWSRETHGMRNEILASKQKNGSMFL
jgi:hypothetical protein